MTAPHPDYCGGCSARRWEQCDAVQVAVDLPSPEYCHCQLDADHEGQHLCEHGFHWEAA